MARSDVLHVMIDAQHVGVLERTAGSYRLTYDEDYTRAAAPTPLSCSLPVERGVHTGRAVGAYIEGLLPDSDAVRARWAREFRTRDNAFDLLVHVGEDCAGAVQLVREERLEHLEPGTVEWIDDEQIAERIDRLADDPADWLSESERGYFSLAGAQPKFALLHANGRWGRPSGALPTTHIFKPAAGRFLDHELNEHLSLTLARAVGLTTALSEIREFAGRRVVVVERYDRMPSADGWRRVHQEDLCQAAGRHPSEKYEVAGGLGVVDVVGLLRSVSSSPAIDVERFLDAVMFNWVIANTDAHARNYSLLLAGRSVRLAPLYDLASALPYARTRPLDPPGALRSDRLSCAMGVEGNYRVSEIRRRDWEQMWSRLDLDPAAWIERARALVDRVEECLVDVVGEVADAVGGEMPTRFAQSVTSAVGLRRAVLAGRPARGYRR